MRKGPIILLLGAVLLAGWLAPNLKVAADRSDDAAAPTVRPETHVALVHAQDMPGDGTVLDRAPDGHFYADALVDSQQVHFLVDTGATIVALTGDDARAAGLDWTDADLVRIGRGASGDVYGVPVRIDHLELGDFTANDVEAAIVPEGLDVSLLGQSFLAHLGQVKIDGSRMVLGSGS